jgi:hypothetical protein
MGAAASFAPLNSGVMSHSSKIEEARAYFSNDILMKGFWAPIDTDQGGSITLTSLRNYLRNTNPENVVALYAGPFIGPFATSQFCLRHAYMTSTGKVANEDLDEVELHDYEFKDMLKHLFFYLSLYSLFGDKCAHDSPLSLEEFTDAVDELSDDSTAKEYYATHYANLGSNPTYGAFVKEMVTHYLNDTISLETSLLIDEKVRGNIGSSTRRSFNLKNSLSLSELVVENVVSCTWFQTSDISQFLKLLHDIGIVPFKALIDDLNVTRVVVAEDIEVPNRCALFQWHNDGGIGYREFEKNDLEDGTLRQAVNDGLITIPLHHLIFGLAAQDGWRARIRGGDVLSLSYFPTKSHVGFCDSYQEDLDGIARNSGAIQNFVGKVSGGVMTTGDAILSHYTSSSWNSVGTTVTHAFVDNPPVKYVVSGPVMNINAKVLATFESFTWLSNA